MKKQERILLLDGDIFCYRVCASQEYELRWTDDLHVLYTDGAECEKALVNSIEQIKEKLNGDRIIFVLSDRGNFRKDVYPNYKSNRKNTRKPMALSRVREFITTEYEVISKPNLEADDVLGILATADIPKIAGEKIIVSVDKDLRGIPGLVYNPDKDDEPQLISLTEANKWFYTQALAGDMATDGYPGCPGIGPKTAEKLLKDVDVEDAAAVWKVIVAAYAKADLSEEYALTQARCARILRAEDYDFKTNSVKLWEVR